MLREITMVERVVPGGPGLQQGVQEGALQRRLVREPDRRASEHRQVDVDHLGEEGDGG